MKKELLRSLLFPFILILIVNFSFAAKIHLKNGYTITGEIISSDETSVTIRAPVLGVMKIGKDKITKIEPPLEGSPEEKELKKEIIAPETPEPKAQEPSRDAVIPQQSKTKSAVQKPILPEFLSDRREKKRISIYLGGGISNINGGDLNSVIRDYNQFINDWNDYYLTDYSADEEEFKWIQNWKGDWKEFEWIQNWKGEVIINLSPSFSFGLGVEYLNSKKKGTITLNDAYSGRRDRGLSYYNYSEKDDYSFEPEQQLIVIPITFNFYYFIPIFNIAEFFLKGGISYNISRFKYNEPYQWDYEYQADHHYSSDGTFWFTEIDNYLENGTYSYEAKSKETGFQVGAGFDIKLFSFISLVFEGTYRYINFKDWTGHGSNNFSWERQGGQSDSGYSTDSGNKSEEWDGKIWYYEIYNSATDKEYGNMSLYEEEPELEFIKNVRAAKINLNGYSLSVGIKINF